MTRRKPSPDSIPFAIETLVALDLEMLRALALWSLVRKKSRGKWTADLDRWEQLSGAMRGDLRRLLEIVRSAAFVTADGELRPEVSERLRAYLP